MKTAIVTLVGDFNYGNRLQNYALQEILKSMGANVTTIDNPPSSLMNRIKERLFERINGKWRIKSKADLMREKNLRRFTHKYISMSPSSCISEDYDYFIVGSDQVWNPSFWGTNTECYSARRYLLRDVSPQKRISYAASFGVEELNDLWTPVFQKELSIFKAISVREASGVDMIRNTCGRDAALVLDPTLVLPREKWTQLAVKVQEQPYILLFHLGNMSEQQQEYIERLAREHNYKVIDMTNKKDPYYQCSPEEFLGLIKNARMVFTDSFHATVFSIIFHTPFLSLSRSQKNYCKMSSRLETLLSVVQMEDRFNNMDIKDPFACSFEGVDELIDARKYDCTKYLRNALGL